MQATESVKVPDGKLVRVAVTYDDVIEDVEITGDFFLQPPDALSALEEALVGHPTDATVEDLAEAVRTVDAECIGFDAEDLARTTVEALE
ncbi:MAG: lipoate protein ligase C-terminal domain-containing protein [Halodesulfurarchaeum sp.]